MWQCDAVKVRGKRYNKTDKRTDRHTLTQTDCPKPLLHHCVKSLSLCLYTGVTTLHRGTISIATVLHSQRKGATCNTQICSKPVRICSRPSVLYTREGANIRATTQNYPHELPPNLGWNAWGWRCQPPHFSRHFDGFSNSTFFTMPILRLTWK